MNKKKVIIAVVILLIIIAISCIGFALLNNKKSDEQPDEEVKQESEIKQVDTYIGELRDGSKINTNANMNIATTLGNLSVDNIRLTFKNGVTTFRANVTNNGGDKTKLKSVTLTLLDENGDKLVSAKGVINVLDIGASQELAISITSDYINACGYEIVED